MKRMNPDKKILRESINLIEDALRFKMSTSASEKLNRAAGLLEALDSNILED